MSKVIEITEIISNAAEVIENKEQEVKTYVRNLKEVTLLDMRNAINDDILLDCLCDRWYNQNYDSLRPLTKADFWDINVPKIVKYTVKELGNYDVIKFTELRKWIKQERVQTDILFFNCGLEFIPNMLHLLGIKVTTSGRQVTRFQPTKDFNSVVWIKTE